MVKNKKMKNIKHAEVLDKKRIKIVFQNNEEIILEAKIEGYAEDSGIYIAKDNV